MLTKNQLKQLRNEITINSIYINDYSNSLSIKPKTVCNFFDSFLDDIYDKESNGLDFYDILEKHDNIDSIYDYYCNACIDGYDPLIRDDFNACYHESIYSGVVVYDIQYGISDYLITASYTIKNGFMVIGKITKNKIYYSDNNDDYFIKNHKKYFIKDFTKKHY